MPPSYTQQAVYFNNGEVQLAGVLCLPLSRLLFAEQQYGPALAARVGAVLTPQAGGRDLLS